MTLASSALYTRHMGKGLAQPILALLFLGVTWAADAAWAPGRIVSVDHRTDTKNTIWVVNTPVTQEEEVYTVTVHVRDRVISARYVAGGSHLTPPNTWVKDRPVQVQIAGDYLYVRSSPADEVRGRITKNKATRMMMPWTSEETASVNDAFAPAPSGASQSMIGFDAPAEPAAQPQAASPEPVAPSPPAELPTGQVALSSTPYLAEVYVDGESMGYTPAKLRLPPGKHSFRCEKSGYKPWTKDITVTAGSELTLDATLERVHK